MSPKRISLCIHTTQQQSLTEFGSRHQAALPLSRDDIAVLVFYGKGITWFCRPPVLHQSLTDHKALKSQNWAVAAALHLSRDTRSFY